MGLAPAPCPPACQATASRGTPPVAAKPQRHRPVQRPARQGARPAHRPPPASPPPASPAADDANGRRRTGCCASAPARNAPSPQRSAGSRPAQTPRGPTAAGAAPCQRQQAIAVRKGQHRTTSEINQHCRFNLFRLAGHPTNRTIPHPRPGQGGICGQECRTNSTASPPSGPPWTAFKHDSSAASPAATSLPTPRRCRPSERRRSALATLRSAC
jgi:hypothetical protein